MKIKVTSALVTWLVAECKMDKEADADTIQKVASKAIADDVLSLEKYIELTKEEKVEEAKGIASTLDKLSTGMEKLTTFLTKEEKKVDENDEGDGAGSISDDKKQGMMSISGMVAEQGGMPNDSKEGDKAHLPRMKNVKEMFSNTKTAMTYPTNTKQGNPHSFAGQPVVYQGRSLDKSTDYDKALTGAFLKFHIASITPRVAGNPERAWEVLPEMDKALLHNLCAEEMWDATRKEGKPSFVKGYRGGVKQLIDDVVSGGFEAAPIVFDDQVIETPLLYGELYPLVHEVPLPRGRRVEGVSIGTITAGWGGIDAVAITLFNTAGYVAAFDTTVYRWEGAVVIGLDFLSDSPIDFGATLSRQAGERLLEDLDDVIAVGNGATQPQGVMNAAGTTVVAFGGATTLGSYEALMFSIHKRELKASVKNSIVFCGTDTSYQRARSLNVTAADARRLGGGEQGQGDYRSYRWMDRPYKINESLTNQQLFYAVLARYRMYRRKGFSLRTSTEGSTLIRDNEMLLAFMARYGGQLERGATAGVTNTAPV